MNAKLDQFIALVQATRKPTQKAMDEAKNKAPKLSSVAMDRIEVLERALRDLSIKQDRIVDETIRPQGNQLGALQHEVWSLQASQSSKKVNSSLSTIHKDIADLQARQKVTEDDERRKAEKASLRRFTDSNETLTRSQGRLPPIDASKAKPVQLRQADYWVPGSDNESMAKIGKMEKRLEPPHNGLRGIGTWIPLDVEAKAKRARDWPSIDEAC